MCGNCHVCPFLVDLCLQVLSVIAQQILTLQRAKAAGVKQFDFEGTRLGLRPTFSIFITMVRKLIPLTRGSPVCGTHA